MPKSYKEQNFEDHIEEQLLSSSYGRIDRESYNKDLCLTPNEVITFIKSTQPNEYKKLEKQYGPDTKEKICYRLSQEVSKYGTLHVLRKGFRDRGCSFKMAYYKPASGMNPEAKRLYGKNQLSVIRQLKYSQINEKSLDMVLFLNGLPVVTMELKNSLTGQFVEDAVKQYKKDRDPREPLFKFKRCLVHFAVGNEKVFMTTRLLGNQTYFLPFNKDIENPINPDGHRTAYLWEDILQKDTLLSLIQNYLHIQIVTEKYYDKSSDTVKEKESEIFVFPRYHQLDATKKLLEAIKTEGVGNSYLIQHSAGSGKSNTIAWLAHQLASFYRRPSDTERLFDSIIVVTDRRILDRQLQNTIKQFEQVSGVVKKIDKHSVQLKAALEKGKDIIVTTLQKFPVISEKMTDLKGKRFAVIIDEAHSSQAGEYSKHMKKTLAVDLEQAEEKDELKFDLEDEINKEMKLRGKQSHISYFAFTATPKGKTLELFGKTNKAGKPVAFHLYTMLQAIEEGFILDVLQNYTTFKRYFKLKKRVEEDKEYPRKKAIQVLTSYVDLQPHAIDMKSRIMLDHFTEKTANAIQGRGRAMVVTRSRLHAVKYYFMLQKILEDHDIPFKPLISFSGTVKDPDTLQEHTEKSINRLPSKVSIEEAFKTPAYRILVVAEKFQTGFDEPLLHTMFVDKRLTGVHAVQALSRLNRTMRGKPETFILDFTNEADQIQMAFQPYYQTTLLEEETDPNTLYDLQIELQQFDVFTKEDIDEFAGVFFNPSEEGEKLQPILDRVVVQWGYKHESKREEFRSVLRTYVRLYDFLSQIITFMDIALEKLFVFAKNLNRKLPKSKTKFPFEVRESVDLDSFRIQKTFTGSIPLESDDYELKGIQTTPPEPTEDEKDLLTNIIRALNDAYGANLSDEDKVEIEQIKIELENNSELLAVMNERNTLENIRYKFNQIVDNLILDFVHSNIELYKKLTEPKVNELFKNKWFEGLKKQLSFG